ncbi:amino acid permease [Candidatus Dependentiae bacterium]|nr:amino acid permease [Candidatus Dependentiae bacterium]
MEDKNKISLFTAILISINIMVGIGIFIVPSLMTEQVGNLSFLGWPLVGLVFLPVVYSIAQITKLFPGQGSFYSYSEQQINKTAGFISGWFYFLGFASVSAIQLLGLKEVLIDQFEIFALRNNVIVFNILFVSAFCLINMLGLFYITKIQNTVTIFKLLPIIFGVFLLFFYWNPELQLSWGNLSSLKFTLPLTLFGFWGFESSCNISHMIKGDKNTPSKAILISFFGTVIIYTLFHLGILHIMGAENLITYKVPGFINFLNIKNPFFLNLSSSFMSATILIAFISSIFGGILSNSSNLHSMAINNLFPKSDKLQKLNRFGRPKYAIWITGITIFILMTLINNKVILNSVCNFGLIVAFTLTLISLLLIQLKKNLKMQSLPTIIAFISCGIISYYSWILMGESTLQRITYALPLIILGSIGIILFKYNDKIKKGI